MPRNLTLAWLLGYERNQSSPTQTKPPNALPTSWHCPGQPSACWEFFTLHTQFVFVHGGDPANYVSPQNKPVFLRPQSGILLATGGTNFGFRTNQFGFNLNGAYGQTIVVDGSPNLFDWTPLFTNTANGNPFYFFDLAWPNFPWRFYRARLP